MCTRWIDARRGERREETILRKKLGAPGLDFETWETTQADQPISVSKPTLILRLWHGRSRALSKQFYSLKAPHHDALLLIVCTIWMRVLPSFLPEFPLTVMMRDSFSPVLAVMTAPSPVSMMLASLSTLPL